MQSILNQYNKGYLLLSLFIFILFACSSNPKNDKPKIERKKSKLEQANLVIEWHGDKIELEDVNIKLSRKFPNTRKEYTVTPGVILPLEPAVKISFPILQDDLDYSFREDIEENSKLEYNLKEGEYFLSIDTEGYKAFRWDASENKRMIATFGFRHNDKSQAMENLEYSGDCVSKHGGFYGSPPMSYSYCKKIKILKGNQTTIKIFFSEIKSSDLGIFPKIIPGILLLAPFNNKDGLYYNHREYKVEIIDLMEK